MSFLLANRKLVASRLVKSEHSPVTRSIRSVNIDPDLTNPLIEMEVDIVLFCGADRNGEIHWRPQSIVSRYLIGKVP
jgi:hypothetical protein